MPNYDKLTLEEILRSLNKGGNSVRGGGSGYGAGYIRPTVPIVLQTNPLVALMGPSTTQMNNAYAGDRVYSKANGPHFWAKCFSNRVRIPVWRDAGNARGYKGFNFGVNGETIANQIANQLPGILTSQAKIVVWNSGRGSGDVDSPVTVSDYCTPVKAQLLNIKAAGKTAVWENLWLRDTSVGGGWASGGYSRSLCIAINAEMLAWCTDKNVYYIDAFTAMCGGTVDNNPKPTYAADDGIHYASPGAYQVGKLYDLLWKTITADPTPYDPTSGSNIFPYQAFSGTGGSVTNSATGTVPDNMTLGRGTGTNARSVTGSIESINSRNYAVITIGSSGTVPATGEGCVLRMSTFPAAGLLTIGNWYQARCRIKWDGWAGFTGIRLIAEDGAATPIGGAGMTAAAGTDGDTPVTAFSLANQYNIRPGEALDLEVESMPFQATNTGLTMRLILTYTNGTGGAVLKTGDWDFRQVTDPNTFL